MSNPAVINLASPKYTGFPHRFDVEDNIGEAIHIHYDDMRLDMTVDEFCRLTDKIPYIIDALLEGKGITCDDFDPVHLVGTAQFLPDIERVEIAEIYLDDMLLDAHDENGKPIVVHLPESRVSKALDGDTQEDDERGQINFYSPGSAVTVTNHERTEYAMRHVIDEGYPAWGGYITVFNNDNFIFDGLHRAACLYKLNGNIKVPVRRFYFKDGKYSRIEGEYYRADPANSRRYEIIDHEYEKSQRRIAEQNALNQVHAILNSTSWRITAPLRAIMRVIKGKK
ncbi:hypothetical protein FACS1894202_07640 [Clostridia bacterium]|nr:hypothetical protein FACS1894202_07640 [Clostridia bacterium]